ncbi:MAG: ABC transporter ATP-binding protein/permease [Intestinibacter sp.]|uniref:ABC transporter ATP-binding protein n=1 Tax=Intestinibacter sp. TaxID=1965304 RepID=UPI0025C42EFD|nr:ABC transporter ATP-binding protein [Intestinibacter sp.]MCI6738033.1 ABC transporter ATP-binding protein/permease [Intestinibacter sp.]
MENRKYKTKELIARFLPYFRPYKKVLLLDLFCAFLTTGCDLILPMILKYLANKGTEDLASITVELIASVAGIYLVLRIIDAIANYYMTRIGHVMGARIETDMRKDAFDHIQKLSDSYFNNTKVGQIMSRITNDLFDVTEFAHHCPEEFFIAGVKIVISFILLSRINIALTTIIFIFIPLMVVFSMDQNVKMKRAFKKQRVQIGELNSRLEDSLLGVRVVKAFANEEIEAEKFTQDNRKFLGTKKETYKYMAGFKIITCIFDGIMYLVLLIAGGAFMMKGLIEPADLFVYTLYVTTLLATVKRIVEFTEQFQKGMTGIERFTEIIDSDIDIFDDEDAEELTDVKGSIEFKDVSFEYNDTQKEVLDHINLSIKEGEKVALVGPSGGGKTTICNLIPRFYDTTEGSIYLDDKDIKKITLKSLRQNIGIVQQDVYLFAGTVYDNIAYGNPKATREQVIEAAKLAGAHEFISELKDGYDSYVGERGVKLSGGQKQRISIARVFLKNPKILILDEATSALDNESEYLVSKSLERLAKGRTTLTIAHRLTTIQNADRILVLTENGIVEEGNHKELLDKKGVYYQLYTMANEIV